MSKGREENISEDKETNRVITLTPSTALPPRGQEKEESASNQTILETDPQYETKSSSNLTPNSQCFEQLPGRVIKRIIFRHSNIKGPGKWGHWWVEIYKEGTNEQFVQQNLIGSFGWYPVSPSPFGPAVLVAGCLNDFIYGLDDPEDFYAAFWDKEPPHEDKRFDPSAPRYNPGQKEDLLDWNVDAIYHPFITDERTDDQVIDCIVKFATSYKSRGKGWEWPYEENKPASSNCRQFIKEMQNECELYRSSIEVKKPTKKLR